eukprot:12825351-Alexandrium_andersonii.AAC.1
MRNGANTEGTRQLPRAAAGLFIAAAGCSNARPQRGCGESCAARAGPQQNATITANETALQRGCGRTACRRSCGNARAAARPHE